MTNANEKKRRSKTVDLVYTAFGAALIAVSSWISIPTAVPFTMQTFAVFFVLSALGGRRGTTSVVIYVLLGAAGAPVFANFSSGVGVLLGSTGGYIVGFVFMGLTYWLTVAIAGERPWAKITAALCGLAALYAFGTAWYFVVYTRTTGAVGIAAVLLQCVVPFIIPDLLKLFLAAAVSKRVSPFLGLR